jgi:hypothetical protein
VIYIPQESSEKGKKHQVVPPVDAEELYRRYLSIRAERSMSRNETDYTVPELKKADGGNILL